MPRQKGVLQGLFRAHPLPRVPRQHPRQEVDGVGGQFDIDRHGHDAGAHAAQHGGDELDAIEREHRHAIAGDKAGAHEPARNGVAEGVELAKADLAGFRCIMQINDRRARRLRVRGEQETQIAGMSVRGRFGNATGRFMRGQGQITTLPNTSRFSISFKPSAAFCSGSTSSITGLILPSWIRSISALRFSS